MARISSRSIHASHQSGDLFPNIIFAGSCQSAPEAALLRKRRSKRLCAVRARTNRVCFLPRAPEPDPVAEGQLSTIQGVCHEQLVDDLAGIIESKSLVLMTLKVKRSDERVESIDPDIVQWLLP